MEVKSEKISFLKMQNFFKNNKVAKYAVRCDTAVGSAPGALLVVYNYVAVFALLKNGKAYHTDGLLESVLREKYNYLYVSVEDKIEFNKIND